jgi:hypothetical protein
MELTATEADLIWLELDIHRVTPPRDDIPSAIRPRVEKGVKRIASQADAQFVDAVSQEVRFGPTQFVAHLA